MKYGFNNDKYVKIQSEKIKERFKLFDKFHKTAEEIAQEAQEITQEYTTKQQEIDQKLDSLTTSSDLSKYKNRKEKL